jgi:hypothetical protein
VRQLQTPDITKAQMVSFATALIGILTSAGVPVSEANANRIYTASIALAVATTIADAVIRFGRALMVGKKVENSDIGLDI